MLATFTVNNPGDFVDSNPNVTTLREAIASAEATIVHDTIDFAQNLNGGTILLTQVAGSDTSTRLQISQSVTVDASMLEDGITIDANDPTPAQKEGNGKRIFNINSSSVELIGLRLTGADVFASGGAVFTAGPLTIRNSIITGNGATNGGGVAQGLRYSTSIPADLTIINSRIEGNSASFSNITSNGRGGGIYVYSRFDSSFSENKVTIAGSTIEGNTATRSGGGIYFRNRSSTNSGNLTIENSTITGNTSVSGAGGGVYARFYGGNFSALANRGVFISNTSITDNHAVSNTAANFQNRGRGCGGGLFLMLGFTHGDARGLQFQLTDSVITGNASRNRGGGIYLLTGDGATAGIVNCNVHDNKAGLDLIGGTNSDDGSLLPHAGGGLFLYPSTRGDEANSKVTIAESTFSDNIAGRHGGGIAVFAKADDIGNYINQLGIYNTTISGNTAGHTTPALVPGKGGGVHLAIFNYAQNPEEALDTRFQNVTITSNKADQGGAVWSLVPTNPGARTDTRLTNTIASGNKDNLGTANSNLFGSFNIAETVFNLIGSSGNMIWDHITHIPAELRSDAAGGNKFTDDPKLAELANNGGSTETHRPLTDSLAIDNGSNELADIPFANVALTTDQRGAGFPRIVDIPGVNHNNDLFTVDIGAYEYTVELPPTITDVVIKGTQPGTTSTPWAQSAWVSMADRVNAGEQLYSIATVGIDRIEVHFSEPIEILNSTHFQLKGHRSQGNVQRSVPLTLVGLDATNTIATFSFDALIADKYALHILDDAVADLAGNTLDGDWDNDDNGPLLADTPDNTSDDIARPFIVGDGTEGSEYGGFRLHFAHLPGDYDGDGEVDGHDFDLLQDQDPRADGDGNGLVWDTGADLLPWQIYFGYYRESYHTTLDLNNNGIFNETAEINQWLETRMLADFNDDEIVDGRDWTEFRKAYDKPDSSVSGDVYAQGDTDYDGYVGGFDLLALQRAHGNFNAWYVASPLSGLTTGAPPQVQNVIVSSSLSAHAPFSFDTVDGSGMQLATVPVGLADTVSMVFSENVNISADSLLVFGMTTANLPEVAEFSYDPLTFTATWRFEGWALGDNYLLYLSDSITDTEGNFLDGEWTNPATRTTSNSLVSTFPSGDGESGGAFIFTMTLLPGDANLDGIVNNSDYSIWSANAYGPSGKLFIQADFNGDGVVNSADLTSYYWNYDTNLQNPFLLSDLDQNGIVNDDDLDILSANYGMTNADWEDGDLNGDSIVDDLDIDLAFAQYGLWFDSVA
jgi:hypothetical protein